MDSTYFEERYFIIWHNNPHQKPQVFNDNIDKVEMLKLKDLGKLAGYTVDAFSLKTGYLV